MRLHVCALVLVSVALSAAVPSWAGAASPHDGIVRSGLRETSDEGGDLEAYQTVAFHARTGERNDVSAEITHTEVVLRDAAAEITAGAGCRQAAASEVRCAIVVDLSNPENGLRVEARADDGQDRMIAATPAARGSIILDGGPGGDRLEGTGVSLVGGPGRDLLIGSSGSEYLAGGRGHDRLRGGGGDDYLVGDGRGAGRASDLIDGGPGSDRVSYSDARSRVVVDLSDAGPDGRTDERDRLRHIEDIEGGAGGDLLIGDGGANVLFAGDGADRLEGRGGPDQLLGDDRDRLLGGAGDDYLYPLRARTVDCGRGQDAIEAPDLGDARVVQALDRSCEWFADSGRVGVWVRRTLWRDGDHLLVRMRSLLKAEADVFVQVRSSNGSMVVAEAEASVMPGATADTRIPLTADGRRYFRRPRQIVVLIADSMTAGWIYEGPIEVRP